MPPAAFHPESTNMNESAQQQTRSTSRPPLRRAVYVHVSDLTSAYNIDHKKLEQELSRVKSEASEASSSPSTQSSLPTTGADEMSTDVSLPQKRLQPPRGGFNLCLRVGKVTLVVDKFRVDRSRVRLAEVEVGDETGTVSLRARDEQIDSLEQISETRGAVVLRNCTLELFQGRHIRLAITKWGKLSIYPDDIPSTPPAPSKLNRDRNFSLIDLSLVASEMVENQPPEGGSYPQTSREGSSERSGSGRGSSRQPFQPPQQQTRRGQPRERRQTRPSRGLGSNPLAIPFPDPSLASQMRYPGVHGYGYGEFPYGAQPPHGSTGGQPTAHQLLQLQHQQYQLQHHQMQQMQAYHEQRQRHQQGLFSAGSPSFESNPADFPSLPSVIPARPMEDREPSQEGPISMSPLAASPDIGPWSAKPALSDKDEMMPPSPRMNPQAGVFSPAYAQGTTGQTLQSSPYQGYHSFDHRSSPITQPIQQSAHAGQAQRSTLRLHAVVPPDTEGPASDQSKTRRGRKN